MTQQITDYNGYWQCTHWYPSNKHVGDDFDEHKMTGRWEGDTLVLEGVPDDSKSRILVRLTIADGIATGSWHETTTPDSDFKGAEYNGYGQLTVDPKTFHMEGKWAGAGYDRKLKRTRIYTGNWEVTPLPDEGTQVLQQLAAQGASLEQAGNDTTLEGAWRSFYRYASSGRDGDEFWGRHEMQATQSGDTLHLESVPSSKSHVVVELVVSGDGRSAQGTWREETDLDGYYKGAVYDGTITVKIAEDLRRMSGTWQGQGKDGETNSDAWEFAKDGTEPPDGVGSGEQEVR